MNKKIRIDICKSPVKRDHTLYINGIRVYGVEPLFEPPVMSFVVEKDYILGALDGLTSYELDKLQKGTVNLGDVCAWLSENTNFSLEDIDNFRDDMIKNKQNNIYKYEMK